VNSSGTDVTRYGGAAIALHWLLVLALVGQVALGWWMLDLPKSPPGLRAGWFNVHKSIGASIGILVLVRLAWRLAHPVPPHGALPAWQRRAATWSHRLLYACMLLLPLSGFLGSSFSGYPVKLFGFVLPSWVAAWPAGKEWMSVLHLALVWLFMALVTLHICAALWHWYRGDGVAARMGLPHRRRTTPAPLRPARPGMPLQR